MTKRYIVSVLVKSNNGANRFLDLVTEIVKQNGGTISPLQVSRYNSMCYPRYFSVTCPSNVSFKQLLTCSYNEALVEALSTSYNYNLVILSREDNESFTLVNHSTGAVDTILDSSYSRFLSYTNSRSVLASFISKLKVRLSEYNIEDLIYDFDCMSKAFNFEYVDDADINGILTMFKDFLMRG